MKKIIKILIGITLLFLLIGAVSAVDNSTNEDFTLQETQIDHNVEAINEDNEVENDYYDTYEDYYDDYDDTYDDYDDYDDTYDDYYDYETEKLLEDSRVASHARVVASSKTFTVGKSNNYGIYAVSGYDRLPHAKITINIWGNTQKDKYIDRLYTKRANRYGFASISLKSLPIGKYRMSISISGYYGDSFYFDEKTVNICIKQPTINYRKIIIKPGSYLKKYVTGKAHIRAHFTPGEMMESKYKRPVNDLWLTFSSKKVKMYKARFYIKDTRTGKILQIVRKYTPSFSWYGIQDYGKWGQDVNLFLNKRYDIRSVKIYFKHI